MEMKKTYKNPTLTVVNIQTEHLMQFGSGTKSGSQAAARGARFTGRDRFEDNEW